MLQSNRKSSVSPVKSAASPGLARAVVATSASACLGLVWAHALAALLGAASPTTWALPLTLAAVGVGLVSGFGSRARPNYVVAAVSTGFAAIALLAMAPPSAVPALALVLLVVGIVSATLAHGIAGRLPAWIDELPRAKRFRSGSWVFIAFVAIVQLGRLSTWMSDPSSDWFLTTQHPFWAKHECLSAYIYGGELALRGEPNVYDAKHYPGLDPNARPDTNVADMTVDDPFQYAPQFLLWPAGALAMTRDYPTIRVVWFAIQATLFFAVIAWLGVWVGGRTGRTALFLWPLAVSAFPALHALQYGQFHLAAIAISVAAMLAFDRGEDRVGGALLAVATLSKIFPGVLLVVLLARRRWRALGWTMGFAALFTAASFAAFGSAPFTAFFEYHLPRLQSGAAFAFGDAWPEVRDMVLVANHGVYGFVSKLGEMGFPGVNAATAAWVNRLYGVSLAAIAWWFGRQPSPGRDQRAIAWLSLLGLASMTSTGAFADYIPLTATWLLTLLAGRVRLGTMVGASLLIVWAFQYALIGTTPIGDYFDARVMLPLSSLSVAMTLTLFGVSLYQVRRPAALRENPRLMLAGDVGEPHGAP